MDDSPLLQRQRGRGNGGPRYHRRRIGIANLAATAVKGRDRVFLLDQFLNIRQTPAASTNKNPSPHSNTPPLYTPQSNPPSFLHDGWTGRRVLETTRTNVGHLENTIQHMHIQYPNFGGHVPGFSARQTGTFTMDAPALSEGTSNPAKCEANPSSQTSTASHSVGGGADIAKPDTMQHRGLLGCPPRVLDAICDMLPWVNKELLSQTCTTLRSRLHPACSEAIHGMSMEERLRHLGRLAQYMPTHVACVECGGMHEALPGDVPTDCFRMTAPRHACKSTTEQSKTPALAFGYHLEYHHVQLALKLSRLGRMPGYVDQLLQPYHGRSQARTAVQYFVRPIVTFDEPVPAFLVFRAMEFSEHGYGGAQPLDPLAIQHLVVCPHASLTECDPEEMRCRALYDAVEDAQIGLFSHRDFACRRCPTDVSLDTQPGRLHVRVWHDFGREQICPDGDAWLAHVGGPKNNEFIGPTIAHVNGSVRARYEQAICTQQHRGTVAVADGMEDRLTSWALHVAAQANVADRIYGRHMQVQLGLQRN